MATLNISDLSVGDWVINHRGYPTKVQVITSDGNLLCGELDAKSEHCTHLWVQDIKPIPITAEMLEKNGWSIDGMYAFLRIDEHRHLEYYYHEHRLRKYYCGVDEWQNHAKVTDITFAVHCYSVHQLQHALRLAGVDKEINL